LKVSWIDERVAQLAELQRRNSLINDQAEKLYEALWTELVEFIKEARQKGFKVSTNGAQFRRTVILPETIPMTRKVDIVLADDKHSISAKGHGMDVYLELSLDSDNIVFLSVDANKVSTREAAIKILDPLLFPELSRL
jgi:ribosomal protein L1